MPSPLTIDPATSALTDPLSYPGETVQSPAVLIGGKLHRLSGGGTLDSRILEGFEVPLGRVLARLGAAPLAERTPSLAVGSNASAAQLLAKFGSAGTVIPVVPTWVVGLRRGFAACVSRHGYIPFAPVADPDAHSLLHVLWLDEAQLRVMDETEPSYTRLHFDAGIAGAEIYRSRFKVLKELDAHDAMAVRDQTSLIAALCGRPWFADLVGPWTGGGPIGPFSAATALGAHEALRVAVRQGFVDEGLVCDDGL